jgi:hypothetical protein
VAVELEEEEEEAVEEEEDEDDWGGGGEKAAFPESFSSLGSSSPSLPVQKPSCHSRQTLTMDSLASNVSG